MRSPEPLDRSARREGGPSRIPLITELQRAAANLLVKEPAQPAPLLRAYGRGVALVTGLSALHIYY
jgi:hypothetical protein